MIRFGIVTTWFERGAAIVSRQIVHSIRETSDAPVFIYARGGEVQAVNDPVWDKPNVCWDKTMSSPMPTDINEVQFRFWIKRNKITHIIFNEQQYWEPVLWAKKLGIFCICYVDYYKESSVALFGVYDQLWCNTKRHYSVFKWHRDCRYIPWGTDVDLFSYKERTSNGSVTFFHSAGMNPHRKGTDLIIASAFELEKRRNDFKVVIHTQRPVEDFFSDSIILKLEKLEAKGLIDIIEKTVPAPGLYHFGEVYLYPTRLEGIGLTVPEAISTGMPVIATNEPPVAEFLDDAFSRKIAVSARSKRRDDYYWDEVVPCTENLSEQMLWYLENPDQIPSHSRAARAYAERCLNWGRNSSMLYEVAKCCRFQAPQPSLVKEIRSYDSALVPGFNIAKPLYRFVYRGLKFLAKQVRR